ncbi:hypothetical protein B0T16DRAFT_403197 [Cercophora newfieldiana]|uniref:NACHT domain-containing protein n=1 Tax=Cercophora newfieldiana TaxID=92897 RepID=A0AA39YEE2_9PEZI|nr:hypothetical protein B0T16DRAFT_403197 [Cercophora newfieldiana]
MDPLTALALSGNVFQFAQFTAGLLRNTHKIYSSAHGASSTNSHLEDICKTLIEFGESLKTISTSPPRDIEGDVNGGGNDHSSGPEGETIARCVASCAKDCEQLLAIVTKLKAKAGKAPRCWSSFRTALAEVWKSSEIDDLRQRITDQQLELTGLLTAVSARNIKRMDLKLNQLREIGDACKSVSLASDAKLDQLCQALQSTLRSIPHRDPTYTSMEDLCSSVSKLSIDVRQYARETEILVSLNYQELPLRHDKIEAAHAATFGWALRDPGHDSSAAVPRPATSLRRWLSSSNGLFWVSGKPGSGKSTFMKFVADNPATKKHLQLWARDRRLLVVDHYFTIHGTPIQRSLEGLLRSLLYSILAKERALIPKLMPKRCDTQPRPLPPLEPWTQPELESILRAIAKEPELSVNICFFIDGLDEYAGDHLGICQTLRELSLSPFVKVCVSSRPWNVFEDEFGNSEDGKLCIHEISRPDIQRFTISVLSSHPRWRLLDTLRDASGGTSMSLVDDVVEKANGVFLWVSLVTRFLREGLTNDDSLLDLRRRLSAFPSDLEDFFRHILDSVDSFYSNKQASALLIALHAGRPLEVEMYMFHDIEYDNEDYALEEPAELLPLTGEEEDVLFRPVFRRLNGRCKGLLERNGKCIDFLHRTVHDFLRTPAMHSFLTERAEPGFCPSLSLLRCSTAWLRRRAFPTLPLSGSHSDDLTSLFARHIRELLEYAAQSDAQGGVYTSSTAILLDNLEMGLPALVSRGQLPAHMSPPRARSLYRFLVLEAAIVGYSRAKLASAAYVTGPGIFTARSPLSAVLASSSKPYVRWGIRALRKLGYGPNDDYEDGTPWAQFVGDCTPAVISQARTIEQYPPQSPALQRFAMALENGTFLKLLQKGADVEAMTHLASKGSRKCPVWLKLVMAAVQMPSLPKYIEPYCRVMELVISEAKPKLINTTMWNAYHLQTPFPKINTAVGQQVLLRIGRDILSKINHDAEAFAAARKWFSAAFPDRPDLPEFTAVGEKQLSKGRKRKGAGQASEARKHRKIGLGEGRREP